MRAPIRVRREIEGRIVRDAHAIAATDLLGRLLRAEPDVLRVLDLILTRLEVGRMQYGDLNLDADKRNWGAEQRAELLDFLVYRACAELTGEWSEVSHATRVATMPEGRQ